MFRHLNSMFLSAAALLVSAGVLVASVPATGTRVMSETLNPCPYAAVVVTDPR
ncbi:hypothetical protein JIG36_29845 [Actinoplanes sp. LDG1-06]|uniref:Uncharacterized protein n=1 Tax=Paractinoplanes ovalisporus TaxID=2810368 RepID=A0ABS2AIQ3_9ACTN|nr:hypothetical protein [Actinoplanes ovalisporus]MBM2619719.1 hypothetical protein [Actinoplanes ovalisporus]